MTGPPSLRARKKLETRARLIDVAIGMFGERGLEVPTIEEIAAAAEVGKGTLYNYFAGKEEIVVAFMMEVEKRVQGRVRRLARARRPLESILADFILYQFRLKQPYRKFVPVLFAQMFTRGEKFLPYVQEMQKSIDPPLRELFEGLQARGLVRRDVNLPDLITTFKVIHFGLSLTWLNDRPPYALTHRLVDGAIRLLCRGLLPATPGRRGWGQASGVARERKRRA